MSEEQPGQEETVFEAPPGVGEPTPEEPQEPDEEQGEAPDEEQAPEEPTEAPAAPQGLSEKDVEKRIKSLEGEASRHWKRLHEIMGDDAVLLTPCPLCTPITPGAVMAGTLDETQRNAVRIFLGDREPMQWKQDPKAQRCGDCDGLGEVNTGSRVQGQQTLPCLNCGGKGWTGERALPFSAQVTPPKAPTNTAAVATNGEHVPVASGEDRAEVERLRAKGFVVLDPVRQ